MKYKVGDKVKVRSDLKVSTKYYMEDRSNGDIVAPEMHKLVGKIVTIKRCDKYGYNIEECRFCWTDGMFEGFATETETQKKEIKLEGNMKFNIKDYKVDTTKETIVVFFEDGDVQKAKCCVGDTYDFERGLEVCIMKHICGGADKYYKALKVADEQIGNINKTRKENMARKVIKARQQAKRAEKRKLRTERKRAERIAEMKEAYLSALKEYNGDTEKAIEAAEGN